MFLPNFSGVDSFDELVYALVLLVSDDGERSSRTLRRSHDIELSIYVSNIDDEVEWPGDRCWKDVGVETVGEEGTNGGEQVVGDDAIGPGKDGQGYGRGATGPWSAA